jgi:hypothetical protein
MVRPPTETDPFGYDDLDRPVAVRLAENVYAYGYEFCHILHTLIAHDCVPIPCVYRDGGASIFVYDPQAKETEMWSGPWKLLSPENIFTINEPEQRGLLVQAFESANDLKEFVRSEPHGIGLKHGQIQKI